MVRSAAARSAQKAGRARGEPCHGLGSGSKGHLERGDLLASAVDELLEAPRQREVALLVQEALVAGVEPAACSRADKLDPHAECARAPCKARCLPQRCQIMGRVPAREKCCCLGRC